MKVTLNIPALFPVFNEIGTDDINQLKLGSLRKILSCSSSKPVRNVPYESWLYAQFTGSVLPVGQIPVASLTAILDGLVDTESKKSTGYWMRADPVYLYPDTHSLILQDPDRLNLQHDEIERIRNTIAPLLEEYDTVLHTPHPGRWYLRVENNAPDLSCTPLYEALMKPVNKYLPQGKDFRRWHTLFNEIQMVLATLDMNLWRQERQQPPVNSLWFWGNGQLPSLRPVNYDCCRGDSDLLKSLCLHSNSCYSPIDDELDGGLAMSGHHNHYLVVYESLMRARQLNDPELWLPALQDCEDRVIAPLVRQLRGREIKELSLISDSGLQFNCSRNDIRSFWRRVQSASEYLLR